MATKDDIAFLQGIIEKQKGMINSLEKKVAHLEVKVEELSSKAEASEQYSRRQCLRIEGIPLPNHEHGESEHEMRQAVHKIMEEAGVDIPDEGVDRIHRIGKVRMVHGVKRQQTILKFNTFHDRTRLYKARKYAPNYRIYLDLTKPRKALLDDANKWIKERRLANCYAFADVNCRLCVKLDREFHYFDMYQKFMDIVDASK